MYYVSRRIICGGVLVLNINYLEAVLAAYRFRSFSEAAESLNLTNSAISKQISQVENELGVKIFNRANRSQAVTLTEDGLRLIADIEDEVERYHTIIAKSEQIKKNSDNQLRIGYVPTVGSVGESRALAEYYLRYPQSKIKIVCETAEELIRKMKSGALDGCFLVSRSISPEKNIDVHGEILSGNIYGSHVMYRSDKMYIGMSPSHPLAGRSNISRADLENETVIKNNSHLGMAWSGMFRDDDGNRKNQVVYMDYSLPSVVEDFVKTGKAVLPTQMYLDAQRKYPHLKFVPLEPFHDTSLCCFIYQRKFQTQALRKFRKCVEKTALDIASELSVNT